MNKPRLTLISVAFLVMTLVTALSRTATGEPFRAIHQGKTTTYEIFLKFLYGEGYSRNNQIANAHAKGTAQVASACMNKAFEAAGYSQIKIKITPVFAGAISEAPDRAWSNSSPLPVTTQGRYMNPPARTSRAIHVFASAKTFRAHALRVTPRLAFLEQDRQAALFQEYTCEYLRLEQAILDSEKKIKNLEGLLTKPGVLFVPKLEGILDSKVERESKQQRLLVNNLVELNQWWDSTVESSPELPEIEEMGRDIRMGFHPSRTGFGEVLAHELFHTWGGLEDRYITSCTESTVEPGYEGNIMASEQCKLKPEQVQALLKYVQGGPLEAQQELPEDTLSPEDAVQE